MKRIVHYSSGFASTAGGVESVVRNILNAFRGDPDYQFTILSRFAHDSSECYKQFLRQGDHIHSLGIPHLTPANMSRFRALLREFFRQNQVDVLHFHGTDEPCVIEEARRAGVKKVIIHIHTPGREAQGLRKLYALPKRWFAGRNIRNADSVLAVSRDSAEAVAWRQGLDPNLIQVLHNCVDTNTLRFREEDRQRYRQALGLDGLVIGHIGRLVDVKNHSFLLRVFQSFLKKVPGARLLLVGDGPLRSQIEAQARVLGLGERVMLLGERMDIPQLLCAMDAFVLPSKFEGFPVATLEAQSTGLPCLLADTVPRKMGITDLVAFCSLQEAPEAWADRLLALTRPQRERSGYSQEIACSGYGFSVLKDQMTEIYHI